VGGISSTRFSGDHENHWTNYLDVFVIQGSVTCMVRGATK
jgi:hypothetical protein